MQIASKHNLIVWSAILGFVFLVFGLSGVLEALITIAVVAPLCWLVYKAVDWYLGPDL